jgi:hypothetical protein
MSKEDAKRRILLDSSLIPSASGELYSIVRVYVIYDIFSDAITMGTDGRCSCGPQVPMN